MLNSAKCPHCNRDLPSSYLPIHQQRCLKKPIDTSKNKTENKSQSQKSTKKEESSLRGSKKKQEKEEWQSEKFQCYLCGHMQSLKELDNHFKQCPNRETQCQHCGQLFPKNLLAQHNFICSERRESSDEEDDDFFSNEDDDSSLVDNSLSLFGEDISDQDQESQVNLSESNEDRSSSSIEERRMIIVRRIDEMCRERSGRREFYERLLSDLTSLQQHIRLRARQEDKNRRGGMTKKQIAAIPNKKYKFDGTNKDICSICYVDFAQNQELKNIECGHLFHVQCISQWLVRNKHCPNCKRVVTGAKLATKAKIQHRSCH